MTANTATASSFFDGNDICSGCGTCCKDIQGLIVTPEELDRVPLLRPYVCSFDGSFYLLDLPKGCPYQLPSGLCGVFSDRPFDCSLFPIYIARLEKKPSIPTVTVVYAWGGTGKRTQCTKRDHFIKKGLTTEQLDGLRHWISKALNTNDIVLKNSPLIKGRPTYERNRREHLYEAGKSLLHAIGLFERIRQLVNRQSHSGD